MTMLTGKEVPFQASNLTELATKAIRHGMTWTCFRPEWGVFLAEGQGHILRRLPQPNLVLEYIPDPRLQVQVSNSLCVESPAVEKLFFGILEGDRSLNLPDYRIGTTEEVYGTMYSLDPTGTATKKIRDNRHPSFAPKCLFGFSDIIPLAAPILHETMLQNPKQSHPIRLPIPAQYTTGLLSHKEGFVVFSHRLDAFINSPPYVREKNIARLPVPPGLLKVQYAYKHLQKTWQEWEDEVLANSQINNRPSGMLRCCELAWTMCEKHFIKLNRDHGESFYLDLMASHLKNAVNWWHQAWNRMREGTARDNFGLRDYIAEGMHLYWDYLELVVEEMVSRGYTEVPKESLREAWVMMIFKGFCWWRSHWMMEGQDMCEAPPRLPSEYYEDGNGVKKGDGEDDFVVL